MIPPKKTPLANPLTSDKHHKRFRSVPAQEVNVRDVYPSIYPMQVGFAPRGQCGVEMTDWWPHLASCADDLAFVRNMWTTDNDHFAENQIHTGRHRLDEQQPSLGAWVHYGLGTLNENLPKFVALGGPTNSTTHWSVNSLYLGPEHALECFKKNMVRRVITDCLLCMVGESSCESLRTPGARLCLVLLHKLHDFCEVDFDFTLVGYLLGKFYRKAV